MTRHSEEEEDEEELACTISLLDPQKVLDSPALLASFKEFFERDISGELRQRLRLLLNRSRISLERRQVSDQYSDGSAKSETISFFWSAGIHKKERLGRICRAVRGFIPASQIRNDAYENIWNSRGGVFQKEGESASDRIKCLFRGHSKLITDSHVNICARRIILVFIGHEVESYTQNHSARNRTTKGDYRAFRWVAEQTGLSQNEVKRLWKSSQNYTTIIRLNGPGALVLVGDNVSNLWEQRLTKEDVKLLLDYHARKLCMSDERTKALNELISTMMVQGLKNYGCRFELFQSRETHLTQCLRKYFHEPTIFHRTSPRILEPPTPFDQTSQRTDTRPDPLQQMRQMLLKDHNRAPERPITLNGSSLGRVEVVLQQIQCYTRMPYDKEVERESFEYLRTMQNKLIYGAGILVQTPNPQAWRFINEGFQMVDGVLQKQSRSMVRLLIRTFGGESWDSLPELRTSLLRHFARLSIARLGDSHPLSIILFHLQDGVVLEMALEQIFLVLMNTLEDGLGSTDEGQFLCLDFCFLLRQQRKYAQAEQYGLRFLDNAERVYGRCHVAARRLLLKVGDVYLHQRRHEQAIETFNDVLQRSYDAMGTDLDIVGVYAHRNLGRIYGEKGENVRSKYHSDMVTGAALQIWGADHNSAEKYGYFTA